MQTGTTTSTSTKTSKSKAPSKPRGGAQSTPTLRLKGKHSVPATHTGDLATTIAKVAYYRAEQRGFEPGHELEDWLHAEQLVRQVTS